jgi:ADP-heptose:LPS heptosyltransferase
MTRALVVRLDNDGDVLLAGPAVRAIAAGAERVALLCGPRGRAAGELLPGVDELLVWRAPWIDPEPAPVSHGAVTELIERVAAFGADCALILGSFHQSPLPTALVLRLAGVPWIGAVSVDYPGSLLDLRAPDPGDVHEVERSLGLAAQAGFPLPPGDDARLRVHARRDSPVAAPYLVVHPGASVSARAWSPDRHAELVAELTARGHRVVVTGSPAERELTAAVAGAGGIDLGGATDLAGLAGVLADADAVVVGNTGPAHLAAAVSTPVVSLFAPTVPVARWRPWKVPHELLHVDVPCAGCRARTCPVPGHPCLEGVGPADVVSAVERLAQTQEAVAA